jgi:hypothetical protein
MVSGKAAGQALQAYKAASDVYTIGMIIARGEIAAGGTLTAKQKTRLQEQAATIKALEAKLREAGIEETPVRTKPVPLDVKAKAEKRFNDLAAKLKKLQEDNPRAHCEIV